MKRHAVIAVFLLIAAAAVRAAGNDWMTNVDGALPISQLSIPGTHDSGALFETFPGTAKCQNLPISAQLDAGVRFLDIRCRHTDNNFTIYHGPENQFDDFDGVLAKVNGFLNANPGETVIMSVKEEFTPSNNTRSFEQTFDSYVAKNPGRWLLGTGIPTLENARNKIVLFRRFGASVPKGIDASVFPDNTTFSIGGRLRVQDRYMVSDNDEKWSAILAILNEARYGGPDTLYVNFSSGYRPLALGFPNIPMVSDNINPRLAEFFAANTSGRFGTILMDFADAERCALIYQTNAPVGRPVAHPAYFMIVNRNSGKAIDLIGGNTGNGAAVNQWTYDYGGRNQRWALAPTENSDHFRLSSWVSGKCACIEGDSTAPGAKLHAFDYTGNNPAQQFDLVDAGSGYYMIRNVHSGLVLEITDEGLMNNVRIQQAVQTGSLNQQWQLQPWGDYFIRAATGMYISVKDSGSLPGSPIVQSTWAKDIWFAWRFERGLEAFLGVATRNGPGRLLAVEDASMEAGADTVLAEVATTPDRQVRIVPLTDGGFKFRFSHSDLSWDIPSGDMAAGVSLEQSAENTNAWQEFQLERLVRPVMIQPLVVPPLQLDRAAPTSSLSWSTQPGYVYQPQWSDGLMDWNDLGPRALPGNGGMIGITEDSEATRRFYRLAIRPTP